MIIEDEHVSFGVIDKGLGLIYPFQFLLELNIVML